MKRSLPIGLLLAVTIPASTLGACAAAPRETLAREIRTDPDPVLAVPSEPPSFPARGAPSVRAVAATSEPAGADAQELSLWNDAQFRRQLTESYMAETEIEPRILDSEREQMQAVLEFIASERLDKAASLLHKLRAESPSALFDFTLANIHFQREELEPAAAAYEEAVLKFPKFRRAWKNLGLIRVRQSDFPSAVRALTRVIELGGADAVTYGLLGYSYSNQEDNLAAESAYRMANLLDPLTLDWKMGLARSFFRQKRFADAVALCGQLIEASPERSDLWLLQANAFLGLGQPMRAAENYELVERLGASTPDSLGMLGDIYVNEGLYELALQAHASALERSPETKVERALRAAKVMTAGGALEETRVLIERIQALRGESLSADEKKDILQLRARIALAQGAGDEEVKVLEEIVALDPLDGEALLLLGQHARRTGEPEKAVFYFERAAGLEAHEADAKVRHAQLLVEQGKYAEALPLLRRAQTLQPRENIQKYLEQVERIAQAR